MTPLIVFDLDGTLVDSRVDLAASADELLELLGAAPLGVEAVASMVGDGARVLVERVLAARQVTVALDDALGHFLAIYERRLVDNTRPYPGIIGMLDQVRPAARLALLTNKPRHHTLLMLAKLGLADYFSCVVGGDEPFGRKPNPDGLLHIISLAGSVPGQTVMVGDSMVDVRTGEAAGAWICAVHYGFGRIEDRSSVAERRIEVHRPEELAQALVRMIGQIAKPT